MHATAERQPRQQRRVNIAADIPEYLADADEALTRYGRWVMWRRRQHQCGSAEGHYRPPAGEALESRREAREVLMSHDAGMICQRALARVPDAQRVVLTILYIPQHIHGRLVPPEAQLRVLRIPPQLSQERHIAGLRAFDTLHRICGIESRHLSAGGAMR